MRMFSKCLVGLLVGVGLVGLVGVNVNEVSAVGVQDFYFSDFTGDYYLSRDEEGISHLKVVENVTAVFPNYEQNKGICRQIPYTNQNDTNVTLPNLDRSNIKVLRNGATEPIHSINKYKGHYEVCTGTEEYLLGEQKYTLEYEFERVVTDYGEYQELYWDTNGNGASQRFDRVTARVHLEGAAKDAYAGKQWCYVGAYGKSGQERCTITASGEGIEFTAANLMAGENLTFDIELLPGSFKVPEAAENYTYVWVTVAVGVVGVVLVGMSVWKFLRSREKEQYYKGIFVKPEYQPSRDYSLPEMAEVYLGKKKDVKVAMLLQMIVAREIELRKSEKNKWSIEVKKEVKGEYDDLLAILNDGVRVKVGDVIEVKRHTASNRLVTLKKAMESKILGDLKKDGLVENKYHIGSGGSGAASVVVSMVGWALMAVIFGYFLLALVVNMLGANQVYGEVMVMRTEFYPVTLTVIVVVALIRAYLGGRVRKYAGHTHKGLEMSRYMEGLEMYIRMAEAERLKFLQSVKGADVSSKGIVKLYEKLLPYAAVFGLEESWTEEMEQYCKVQEIEEPDYLLSGITAYELTRTMQSAAGYATSATTYTSSSVSGGGSWSSGSSGGGGGGFSGGGGGGGGFGGR